MSCTMPEACVAAGALLGLSVAALVPRSPREHRVKVAWGMALGVGSVAALRCVPLFLGDAVGLLGGLLAGVVAPASRAGRAVRAAVTCQVQQSVRAA